MGGFLRRNQLNALVAQCARVDPLEQSLPAAQKDRRDREVHLVDEAGAKILLEGVGAATASVLGLHDARAGGGEFWSHAA